jgi:hypothetical protein
MKIAMEIPFAHLEELSQYTDFDFALAHLVLKEGPNSFYVKFYREQSRKGRTVWMDNSWHELGRALPLPDLLKAAKMIEATHIVAPEEKNNPTTTMLHVLECVNTIRKKGLPYKVVGTWWGFKKDLERLQNVCDEVALPFRKPRTLFLTPQTSKLFHYFGMRSLDEIKLYPPKSIDTSLPIRAAMLGIDLKHRERRPKTPPLNLKAELTAQQIRLVVSTLQWMRQASGSENE